MGTGFIVLDVIRNSIGTSATERRFAGGSCGNVLTILAYFGWGANAVGRIGDDHAGRELVADLAKWGVETKLLQVEAGRGTPIIVQENYLDTKGRPRHRFSRACPVCGATLPAYRPLLTSESSMIAAKLPSHSVFYFDRVAPGTLELAQKSRANGALVVFEPSGLKDERLFTECLKAAHVVKYANDRIEGIHDVVAKAKVPIEIETLGAKGLRLRVRIGGRPGAWKDLPAFSAPELRDAAGSGDWTTAGLIHSLMAGGQPIEKVLADGDAVVLATRQGQALAALNCGFEGARGLMYEADAKRVLDLAGAIVKGTKQPSMDAVQPKKRTNGRTEKACLSCSGTRALHQ
ncbi:PfkB family carbohydrate kinase [Myxococcus faecalis]|uniref:PfkB family carbohydrate kinase n=1 Tax=Myxococcus faecalis TaxID=3115646 RepID=UPI0038D01035